MRILYVITHGGRGGAQQNVLALARGLVRAGHEVQLACGGGHGWLVEEARQAGALVHDLRYLRRSYNPFDTFRLLGEVKDLVAIEQPDLVHFHSSNALLGALGAYILGIYRPRLVFTVHGWSILHPGWRRNALVKAGIAVVMRMGLRLVDRVVYVCRADRVFGEQHRLSRPQASTVIYNGVDVTAALLPYDEARCQLTANEFTVGSIARFDYAKHLDLLVEAAALVPGLHVRLIGGGGPEQRKLERLIQERRLSDRVRLMTEVPRPSACLRGLDCFVMCSRFEGLPYALLEAALAEVPIVAAAVGGIPEVLQHGTSARLVPPNDAAALAEEIRWVRDHAAEAKAMAAAARRRILADFTEEEMISRTLELYLDAVARR